MSRQSKARNKKKLAVQFTKIRKDGGHGPAKTVRKSTKSKCWFRDRKAYYERNMKKVGAPK